MVLKARLSPVFFQFKCHITECELLFYSFVLRKSCCFHTNNFISIVYYRSLFPVPSHCNTHTHTHLLRLPPDSLWSTFLQDAPTHPQCIPPPHSPPPGACRITSRPTASHCRAPCAARPRSCRRRVWRHCRTTSSSPTWWTCCSGRLTAAARRPPLSTTSPRWLQASCSPAPTMEAT